jgi:hypothetical protein
MRCIAKTGELINNPLLTITGFPASLATANYAISDDKVLLLNAFANKADSGEIKRVIIKQSLSTTGTLNTGGLKIHIFDDNRALIIASGDAVDLTGYMDTLIDTVVCESSEWVVIDAQNAILSKAVNTDVWADTNVTELPILLASNDVNWALPTATGTLTIEMRIRNN